MSDSIPKNKHMSEYSRELYWVIFIIFFIVFSLFCGVALIKHYEAKGAWEATTATFGLLGVLLTAGASFAGASAVFSYVSINSKLKESQEALSNFETLNNRKKQLEADIKTIEAYKIAVKELNEKENKNIEQIRQSAQEIIKSENAQFHHRIMANAILNDQQAESLYEQAKSLSKQENWQKAEKFYKKSVELWRLLFLYDENKYYQNYIKSMFRLAVCKAKCQKGDIENYKQIIDLYDQVISIANERDNENKIIVFSYNNCGIALGNYANVVKEKDLDKAIELWKEAFKHYQKAIAINPQYSKALNNWERALNAMDIAIKGKNRTDAEKIYQEAKTNFDQAKEKFGKEQNK